MDIAVSVDDEKSARRSHPAQGGKAGSAPTATDFNFAERCAAAPLSQASLNASARISGHTYEPSSAALRVVLKPSLPDRAGLQSQ